MTNFWIRRASVSTLMNTSERIALVLLSLTFVTSASADAPSHIAAIYNTTGIRGGLVVHVGCGDGKTTAALRINDSLLVHGLDEDPQNVATAREYINSLNIYGKVSVNQFDGIHLPYADDLVNLLVVEKDSSSVERAEVLRVLAPRGVALVNGEKIVKPVPSEIGEWTHYLHGPDNNAVSKDTKVAFPKHLQWEARRTWARHHQSTQGVEAVVSSQGRIFYIIDDAEASIGDSLPDQWNLVARDAFNGVELWRKPLDEFSWKMWTTGAHNGRFSYPKQRHRRLVAVGDRVYVTLGFEAPVSVLDAATGELIRTIEGTEFCSEVICCKDVLYLGIRTPAREEARYHIRAVNPTSGDLLWKSESYKGYPGKYPGLADLSLIVGDEYVIFQDAKAMVCLDIKTGNELWQSNASYTERGKRTREPPKSGMQAFCRLIYHDGIVYLLNPYASPNLSAVLAKTGSTLWQEHKRTITYGTSSQMFVAQGLLWVWNDTKTLGALDLRTGAVSRTIDLTPAYDAAVGHLRCYPEKGTTNTLWTTIGGKDQQIVDLNTGEISSMPWLRAGCRIGVLPCNGLIYMTPHPCMCHSEIKMKGFLALANSSSEPADTGERLTKGPAYGNIPVSVRSPEPSGDWPMFRHDPTRENAASTTIGKSLSMSWEAEIGGKLTQPVIANGMVYVASIERHTVHALNEDTGEQAWTYFAGGRVDSAVTYYEGNILFGSSDGHAYCLCAKDGSLIWKLRVAPQRRNIVALGQLESAWPVHGSLLVHDGKVVVVAGRSSYLDGGIYIALLDPDTGTILKESRINTTGLTISIDTAPGALRDILVAKGDSVYMHFSELSLEGPEMKLLGDGTDLITGGPGTAAKAKVSSMFLTGSGGMLHDGFFHRSGMMYGKSWGQVLAVDNEATYAVRLFPNWNNHGGPSFVHGQDKASLVRVEPSLRHTDWSLDIPLVARAIIAVGDQVVVGGAPDEIDPTDPWKGYEGRGTGKLFFYSKQDGGALGGCDLTSVPVRDGLSAANRKLFVSLKNGTVQCWR